MPLPLEQYAVIGDTETAALVGTDGSIDWLCLPRFDSGACFAALLGGPENGRWLLAPRDEVLEVERSYRPDTLVLETVMHTASGSVRITDCMPPRQQHADLVRLVEGLSGEVALRFELVIRFDYGWIVPWVRTCDGVLSAVAGPDAVVLHTPMDLHGDRQTTVGEAVVRQGDKLPFVLTWYSSHQAPPPPFGAVQAIADTTSWWQDWSSAITYQGPWRSAVVRSLITLKALTYGPTGAILAAATTSVPERLGGARNWDYRFCWLRDATFTLRALLAAGLGEEAGHWRNWLLRTAMGNPDQLQVLYGPAGEHRLPELTLDWLAGYEGSSPVRIGNAAAGQFQLDIYGEVLDAFHLARSEGLPGDEDSWRLQVALADFVEQHWQDPDEGLWEVRGPRRPFTHSKVLAWVALDRMVRGCEDFGRPGPLERWRALRDRIHADVCRHGFNPERKAFTQSYGSDQLDASLLLLPLVGFLPVSDPRIVSTVAAIQADLSDGGLIRRYDTEAGVDGLPAGEGAFLACSFWLVDNLALQGRQDEAVELFERLLSLRNDVGLLSEEYDLEAGRLVGNFPQAFSHVGLVNSAVTLAASARSSPAPGMRDRLG